MGSGRASAGWGIPAREGPLVWVPSNYSPDPEKFCHFGRISRVIAGGQQRAPCAAGHRREVAPSIRVLVPVFLYHCRRRVLAEADRAVAAPAVVGAAPATAAAGAVQDVGAWTAARIAHDRRLDDAVVTSLSDHPAAWTRAAGRLVLAVEERARAVQSGCAVTAVTAPRSRTLAKAQPARPARGRPGHRLSCPDRSHAMDRCRCGRRRPRPARRVRRTLGRPANAGCGGCWCACPRGDDAGPVRRR